MFWSDLTRLLNYRTFTHQECTILWCTCTFMVLLLLTFCNNRKNVRPHMVYFSKLGSSRLINAPLKLFPILSVQALVDNNLCSLPSLITLSKDYLWGSFSPLRLISRHKVAGLHLSAHHLHCKRIWHCAVTVAISPSKGRGRAQGKSFIFTSLCCHTFNW